MTYSFISSFHVMLLYEFFVTLLKGTYTSTSVFTVIEMTGVLFLFAYKIYSLTLLLSEGKKHYEPLLLSCYLYFTLIL